MKSIVNLFHFALCLLIVSINYSCFQDSSIKQNDVKDSLVQTTIVEDHLEFPLWEYDVRGDSMVQHEIPNNVTAEMVIREFNDRYAGVINLDLQRITKDTVFLKIDDATYLTQRMGTTGAFAFMAELVYSLTEVPSVYIVNLDFEEGDHASPGVYRRADFDTHL